jgi:hypothetical protein
LPTGTRIGGRRYLAVIWKGLRAYLIRYLLI